MASPQHFHQRSHQRQQQQQRAIRSSSPPPPKRATTRLEEAKGQHNGTAFKGRNGAFHFVGVNGKMTNGKLRNGGHGAIIASMPLNGVYAHQNGNQENGELAVDGLGKMPVPLPPATMSSSNKTSQIYKLVLTGGPCGGKTTGQERLATFFEGLGWKVFTIPETASILLNGRVRFQELTKAQSYQFQKDLVLTLLQIEKVFFNQANMINGRNVLIICDRGTLDPSAYMDKESWDKLQRELGLDAFDLRDNRYNQIVHMVTAADGATQYYTCANNTARMESMEEALEQDRKTREAWIGHQCLSIVDNSDCRDFNDKIMKLIKVVSERLGITYADRFAKNSKKRKWLVRGVDEAAFRANKFEEFTVVHQYLMNTASKNQIRLRSRCQNGRTTYTLTTRRYEAPDRTKLPEPVETRKNLTRREFENFKSMHDRSRSAVHKRRRCFVFGNVYFHLDTFVDPLPPACNGQPLMILETYTTKPVGDEDPKLPPFLQVDREITGEPAYSMYNLAGPSQIPHQNGNGK